MQICTMRLGDGGVSGIWLYGFHGYAPSRGFAVSTPYASRHRVFVPWFLSHPIPLRIWGLRFVEVQVPWIMEDHGSVLECWRLVLSAAFISLEFV